MEERLSGSGGEIAAAIRNGVAIVTLDRPKQLNALTQGMIDALAAWLDAWERDPRVRMVMLRGAGGRAFCAGGDIRALRENHGSESNSRFMTSEYALDFRIHTYPKPTAADIDGVVMGGGMGFSQGTKLRIVGSRTRMAMPETAIGLFPDVGASWFLSRCPGHLGEYLGLTGVTMGAADAIHCGLADHYIGSEPLVPGEVERMRAVIDRHFSAPTVEAIVGSLRAEHGPECIEWAHRTLAALDRASPTMLKVALEQVRRGRALTLAECFRMELTLIHAAFDHGDYVEGIRARMVDKDDAPRWKHATLAEVDDATVARFFAPRWPASRHPLAHLESRAA